MYKLKHSGLKKTEVSGIYLTMSVTPVISVVDYIKLLKIEGVLEEKEDAFFLKQKS
jgi:hypothetical protein